MSEPISLTVCAPAPTVAQTRIAFERLQNARMHLEKTFVELKDKVADVTLPPGPASPKETGCAPAPLRSLLANAMDTEAYALEVLNGELRELIDQLDL